MKLTKEEKERILSDRRQAKSLSLKRKWDLVMRRHEDKFMNKYGHYIDRMIQGALHEHDNQKAIRLEHDVDTPDSGIIPDYPDDLRDLLTDE